MDATGPIAHFLGFAALLRRAGFAVAPEQSVAWLAAIELLGPRDIGDIRRAARATLAPPPDRMSEFDALFDQHFLGASGPAFETISSEEERLRAIKQREGMKLGGLVNIGVGIGLTIMLYSLAGQHGPYMVGIIPGLIGVALLLYVYVMAAPIDPL